MKEYKKDDVVQFKKVDKYIPDFTSLNIPNHLIIHGSTIYNKNNKNRLGEIVEKYEDLYIVKVHSNTSRDGTDYIQLAFHPEQFRMYKEASNYINYDIY